MKVSATDMRKLFLLGAILLVICLPLVWYAPQYIYYAHYLSLIPLLIVLTLVLTPIGSLTLADKQSSREKLPTPLWFLLIIVLELSLLGCYLGISYLCGSFMPINTLAHPDLFQATLSQLNLHYGLFPWTIYALLAISLAWARYRQQKKAYISDSIKLIIPTRWRSVLSRAVDVSAKQNTNIVFSTTILMISLLLASLAATQHTPLMTGLKPQVTLLVLILLVIVITPLGKIYINRILDSPLPLFASMLMHVVLLAGAIIVLNILFYHANSDAFKMPTFYKQLIQRNWTQQWQLFSYAWWLSLAPMVAAIIAKISRGFKIRQLIFAVSVLPLALCIILYFLPSHHLTFSRSTTVILSLLGFLLFMMFITAKNNLDILTSNQINQDENANPKELKHFLTFSLRLSIASLYLYLPTGIIGLNILVVPFSIPLFVISLAACALVPIILFRT